MSDSSHAETKLLVPASQYMLAGVHIGTTVATKEMKRFVKLRSADGLNMFDIEKIDERLRIAAKAIARYDPTKVIVVSTKEYGTKPVEKFAQYTGVVAITKRFPPGIFSNPKVSYYRPASLVFIVDPKVDDKAVREASIVGIPVIALCDTDNSCSNIDLIIPANNKGRKSLALIFWILAREVCRAKGIIAPDASLPEPPSAFEYPLEEVEPVEQE
ncbi:30S ribosomal protein S2 [archaeon]|jgi:small subunit ribosomal protein S2|nr:30S ribosomal protein S2 [archaeon]NHV06770.1 30S ribosomal protein S2 [Nitrososphaerota archaeon]